MLSPISKALGGGRRGLFAAKGRQPAAAAGPQPASVKSPPARAMLTRLALQQAYLSSASKDPAAGAGEAAAADASAAAAGAGAAAAAAEGSR